MIFFLLFGALSLEEKLSQSLKVRAVSRIIIQNDDFILPRSSIVWYGLPEGGVPTSARPLFDVLKEKQEEYKNRDFSVNTNEPSHLVARVGNYFLKFLNLTNKAGISDENADNEVICHALYKTLGIEHLSPKVGFAYLQGPNQKEILVQVTEAIDGDSFSKETTPDPKNYSWQYLMSLLLSLPDAKEANIIVKSSGDIVFIDKEMAFALPTVYRPGREFVAGVYSALFTHPTKKTEKVDDDVMKALQKRDTELDENPIAIFHDLICILEGSPDGKFGNTIVSRWYKNIKEISAQHQEVIDFSNQKHLGKLFWKMLYVCRGIKEFTSKIVQHKEKKGQETFSHEKLLKIFYARLHDYMKGMESKDQDLILFGDADTSLTSYPEEKRSKKLCAFLKSFLLETKDKIDADKRSFFMEWKEINFPADKFPDNGDACFVLGQIYEALESTEEKKTSNDMYEKSATKGSTLGMIHCAWSKNVAEKFALLKTAAEQGSEVAARSYTNYLAYSRDQDKGPGKAIKFLEDWVEQYTPNFHIYDLLGSIYTKISYGQFEVDDWDLISKSNSQAYKYYELSSRQKGSYVAKLHFAVLNEFGRGSPLELTEEYRMKKSFELYSTKTPYCAEDRAKALLRLAIAYKEGGLGLDSLSEKEKTEGYLENLLKSDLPAAHYRLGLACDEEEKRSGVCREALSLYYKAAKGGHVQAIYKLYRLYIDTKPIDHHQLDEWIRYFNQEKDDPEELEDICAIATAVKSNANPTAKFLKRERVPEWSSYFLCEYDARYETAKREGKLTEIEYLLEIGAELGDRAAQYKLAELLFNKRSPELERAYTWCHSAALAGDYRAMYLLAMKYKKGIAGILTIDLAKYQYWLERSADAGCFDAQIHWATHFFINTKENISKFKQYLIKKDGKQAWKEQNNLINENLFDHSKNPNHKKILQLLADRDNREAKKKLRPKKDNSLAKRNTPAGAVNSPQFVVEYLSDDESLSGSDYERDEDEYHNLSHKAAHSIRRRAAAAASSEEIDLPNFLRPRQSHKKQRFWNNQRGNLDDDEE